ncbi:siderophore-iron reductase FhuF [Entomohabitans teleogrylli]|uniref:siderophore-iron reductase FhuF n=1 Tax=Entomohabitans teleogrylli TaxID=1384589 RepID=UPI00073D1EF0|nr:siderophore-iron reductase FhuF [Entomohabitans teleogrylli]
MALRSALLLDESIRPPDMAVGAPPLSQTLHDSFAARRPYFNELITFTRQPAQRGMTLDEWRQPVVLASLLAVYSDHIYRNDPHKHRENKPLKSLWTQWYIGLLVPPLMLIMLTQPLVPDLSTRRIYARFHETGRAAKFDIDTRPDQATSRQSPRQRLEILWRGVVAPLVEALEQTGDINGKLIWSNTGYLAGWFLNEIKPLIGETLFNELRQPLFFDPLLLNGDVNPLFRTMIVRDGLLARRTCCQRNRLPGVAQCGDCTLK